MLVGQQKLKIKNEKQSEHFNLVWLGVSILDMSKYAMAKVQCLAYDLKIRIFYMDTDSMFIERSGLEQLEKAYEKKYGEKLIGKQLGQMHGDFEVCDPNEDPETILATAAIFLGRKQYLIKLIHPQYNNKITYVVRWKGIPQETIRYYGREKFATADDPEGLMNLYSRVYYGEEINFDIAKPKPRMIRQKDYTYTTKTSVIRTGKTTLKEMKPKDYFNQI